MAHPTQDIDRLQAENAELRRRLKAAEQADVRLSIEHEISRILARANSVEEVLRSVLCALRDGLGVDYCALWLPEEDGNVLRCAQHVTAEGGPDLNAFVAATRALTIAPGFGLPGRAWQSGRAVWVETLSPDDTFPRFAAAIAAGLRTGVAAPLPSDGGCLGVIEWFCCNPSSCDPDLLATVEALGAEVGQFLLRKRAEAAVEVRARQQQALASLGMAAIYEGDLQKLFDEAVETVARVLGVPLCKVLERSPDGNEVLLRAGVGWREGLVGRATVSTRLHSQAGYTLATDEPIIVDDLRKETRFHGPPLLHEHGVVSGLSCIIPGSAERAWGVLGAHATSHRRFTRDDVAFLQGVANVLAASIQQRQAKEEVERQRRLLSALVDALPVGVIVADAGGRILRDNAVHRELWGIEERPEVTSGEAQAEWVGYWPNTGRRIQTHEWAMARALLKGETVRGELVLCERFGTGERRYYMNNAAPILDAEGKLIGGVVAEVDVTEAKQAEERLRRQTEALRETEERYRLVSRATNDVVWDWDLTTNELLWNEALESTFGYRLADVPREIQWWYEHLHPEDRERVVASVHAVIDGGGDAWHDEYRFCRADGTYARVLDRGHVRHDAGRPVRMIGSMLDLTERLAAEEALKEADRRKDEFLAMLAHELRNPLAPIRNAVQIMRLLGPKEPKLESARDMVERQVSHLVRLVDDLLDVSRVSRGKITLQKGPLELSAVVRQAVETSRPLLDARRHALTLTMPLEPVRVEGDFTRLSQVVSNLLNNAAKYTDDGGRITLTVERAGRRAGAEAVIRVRDSGRGIDPKAIGNLFDLFYQVDRNLDRSEGGLGIGLSLVKSLVEMHGGRVEAHSEGRGHGSEFVVRLPCLPAEPEPRRLEAPVAPANAARGLRILVVDDNRDSVETMALLLGIDGHEPLMAYDGRKAVEMALAERPDVVFLDIGLPYLDGYQACRAMRAGGLSGALVVAMTGYGQEEDRRLSQEAGFDAHLVKPVDLRVVRELLAELGAREG